jgi:hypothetical protein
VIDYVTGLGERAELIRMRAVEASQVNMLKVQAGPSARSPWAADVRRSGSRCAKKWESTRSGATPSLNAAEFGVARTTIYRHLSSDR